ncbi:MAG: hypothetical protein AABW54_01805 [Candidatus Micrarchaeota archaeon]
MYKWFALLLAGILVAGCIQAARSESASPLPTQYATPTVTVAPDFSEAEAAMDSALSELSVAANSTIPGVGDLVLVDDDYVA